MKSPPQSRGLFLLAISFNLYDRFCRKQVISTQQFEIHAIKAAFSTINSNFTHSYPEKQSLSERLPFL
jgi:hypothetical protein